MDAVALVIPVYATEANGRLPLLRQTLRSFDMQTHPNSIAVVVDDGSPVGVEAVVNEFGAEHMRYVRRERQPNDLRTASNALNVGLELCLERNPNVFTYAEAASLRAVGYLHSDDCLTPDSIENRLARITDRTGLVHSDIAIIDEKNRVVGVKRWGDKDYVPNIRSFSHHSTLWTARFLEFLRIYVGEQYGQTGIFDPKLSHGEDLDVSASSIEIAMKESMAIEYMPSIGYVYRSHRDSITGDSTVTKASIDDQHRHNAEKHHALWSSGFYESGFNQTLLRRMLSDLPWSIGYPLPDSVKRHLRPIRDAIKRSSVSPKMSEEEARNLDLLLTQLSHT